MITQPDGYQHTEITIAPRQAHDIIDLLIDVHGLLDYLYENPDTSPEVIHAAGNYLYETLTGHTLGTLIDAVDRQATELTQAMRHAIIPHQPTNPQRPSTTTHR